MKFRFIVIFVSLMLTACASPEKDWNLATRDDSQNAYLEFMAKHPNSEFVAQARIRIDELKVIRAWERAEFKKTLTAYQAFNDKYADRNMPPQRSNGYTEFSVTNTGKEFSKTLTRQQLRYSSKHTLKHRKYLRPN